MTRDPRKDPIGAGPVLPTPEGEPAKRAREMFSAYLAETRAFREREVSPAATESPAAPVVPPPESPPPSPRRYDLALRLLGGSQEESDAYAEEGASSSTAMPPPPAEVWSGESGLPRPPVGAAQIRPSAPARPAPEAIDQSLLETLADNALLHQNPDGTAAFEISFHDEVFQDLACSIHIDGGEVVATFRATDANTRRLLESEAGRLRVRLEDRGLRVKEVLVAGDE
ncbi:MAG: flagellar hook-length control protein FliK [Myxococcota bacterium]